MRNIIEENTRKIKQKAVELGFTYCGVSKAAFLEEESDKLETWLSKGFQGKMGYLERNFDKRLDPRLLVDDAKSIISVLLNYYPKEEVENEDGLKVSKYAYGKDYHYVIKDKLKLLTEFIEQKIGAVSGRAFVDSAPVMDRAWAKKSGLGWIGKNTLLISKKSGSFFFIGELILDLELTPDGPIRDYCGTCTRCIDACPTEAISPYEVDGSKCISYLTIELKDEIPNVFKDKWNDWIFGCDICQDVCPWNRLSKPHTEPSFEAKTDLLNLTQNGWEEISNELFNKMAKDSPIKRAKLEGVRKNVDFIKLRTEKLD